MRARKYSSVCTLDGVAYVSIGIDISGSCSLGWDLALLCGDFMQTISQLLRLYADFYCNKKRRRSFVTSPVQAGQCGSHGAFISRDGYMEIADRIFAVDSDF